jgi:type IV fimbrial biogenesis protein FimT
MDRTLDGRPMGERSYGFTLVELLVTVTVVAVLLAMAWPSYQQFVADSRVTGQANEFLTALNLARSEAVKRNTTVTMCRSSDGASCGGTSWQQGWIVFVDGDPVGSVESGDTILRVGMAFTGGSTLVPTADVADYVSYVPSGRAQLASGAAQGGTFNLCSNVGLAVRRDIVVTANSGRAYVEKPTPAVFC